MAPFVPDDTQQVPDALVVVPPVPPKVGDQVHVHMAAPVTADSNGRHVLKGLKEGLIWLPVLILNPVRGGQGGQTISKAVGQNIKVMAEWLQVRGHIYPPHTCR